MGFLSSLLGKNEQKNDRQQQQEQRNFDILKYDGIRARNIGQLPYAIRCFEEAIALNGSDVETVLCLAKSYLQLQRLTDARTLLEQFVERETGQPQIWLTLAHLCFLQEDYTGMGKAAGQAIALDERNPLAHYLAGKAAYGEQNFLQAIVLLTQALSYDETLADAYLLRAEVLWHMGQAKDALEDVEKVLSAAEPSEEALLLKSEILATTGDTDAAATCLDAVLEMNPFNEKAYRLKGNLLLLTRQTEDALRLYDEAIDLMPENSLLYAERGRARLQAGDKEGSIADIKKAIELNPACEQRISGTFDNH